MKMHTLLQSLAPAARRTSLMLALGTALITAPMLAQDTAAPGPPPPPPPPQHEGIHGMHGMHGRHHRQMEHMKKELNLTDDQVNQIKGIDQQSEPQMRALHEDTTLSKEDRHSKMMEMRKEEHEKIRAVLNDEQKEKFDKMMQRHMEKREEHHEKNQAPVPNAEPAPPSV